MSKKLGRKRTRWEIIGSISIFLAAFFYMSTCLAFPESATIKSALVWRTDAQGDFIFSPLSSAGTYEINPAYVAQGQIETITASWKFKGEVRLEVSADEGVHYTSVVCGVPLTAGFVKGNRLKWRATLSPDSELTEVRLAYTDTTGVMGTFGEPQLSGFKFRKSLLYKISNAENVESEEFNYQVQIKVGESAGADADVHCDGNIKADFKDVRFTCCDGETLLPYYIESIEGSSPNRLATVWVNIPQVPPRGVNIYIYYGNSAAEDLSNGGEVFDFFDDFNQDSLDAEKWSAGQEGYAFLSNSQLRLGSVQIFSKDYQIKDGIIEYRARAGVGNGICATARSEKDDFAGNTKQIAYSSTYQGAEHCLAVGDIVKVNQAEAITPGTTYDYRVILDDTNLTFQRYSEGYQQLQAEATYNDTGGLTRGSIGLKADSGCINYFEWVRVRKYSPYTILLDKQAARQAVAEQVEVPDFVGVELSENGNLILKDDYTEGQYTSKAVSLAFDTRIMIPSLCVVGDAYCVKSLDISTDNGRTYKTNCANGTFYYASRGDFSAGDELQFRLELLRRKEKTAQIEEVTIDHRPGKILVISPNGKEAWKPQTTKQITWTALEYEQIYKMKIEYSLDKGKRYTTIIKSTENTGSYLWDIPEDAVSDNALIKVSDAYNSKVFDTSDMPFSISTKEVTPEGIIIEELLLTEEEVKVFKKLIARRRPRGAQAYDVVIKLGDNYSPDPEEDASACYKHGDIVLVRPTGYQWGAEEKKKFLIIQLYLTEKEARQITRPKEINTGRVDESGRPIMKTIKRRAKWINLEKFFGLSKGEASDISKKRSVENTLKGKTLKPELIEEK